MTDKRDERTSLTLYTNDTRRLLSSSPFLLLIDGEWFDRITGNNAKNKAIIRWLLEDKKELLPNRIFFLFILLIDGEWFDRIMGNSAKDKSSIKWLLKNKRELLPNRILFLYKEVGCSAHINRKWRAYPHGGNLYSSLLGDDSNSNETDTILSAYRAWLLNWKPLTDGEPWDLWIGLERQASQVSEAWERVNKDDIMDNETKKLVRIMVKSRDSVFSTKSIAECYASEYGDRKEAAQNYWAAEYDRPIRHKRVLLFDNHGNCFPEAYQFEKSGSLKDSTRFYQKLSGSVSPDLFRMLSRPPQDEFSFRFFIYSLVESCLTNVAVVDERLAWSLVEGYGVNESNHDFAQDLLAHQKAGVFPIFRFRQSKNQESQDNNVGFYTTVHADRLRDCLGLRSDVDSFLEDEGIYLVGKPEGTSGGNRIGLLTPDNSDSTDKSGAAEKVKSKGYICLSGVKDENKDKDIEIDVLLIHEGAMDILASQMGVDWKNVGHEDHENQLKSLYELAPIIIRTSGRGRKSKLLGEHLPFIEFGQVSSSLLTARNKFALVRGLLGSVGSERADGNP